VGDRLVRWGLPRAANAVPYLMEFIAVAVATVLITRAALALAGYPQIGGGGLHIAHVLWGGLLLAVGVMMLLSFNGTTVKPVGSFLAGVGFGLFIDEVGKFLTSDSNYFFSPAAAVMYVTIVVLVLAVQAVHGRRPLSAGEQYVAALQTAASGVGAGLDPHDRDIALRRLAVAKDLPASAEAAALLRALPAGRGDRYARTGARVSRRVGAVLRSRAVRRVAIVVLVIQTSVTVLVLGVVGLAVGLRAAGVPDVTLDLGDPVPTAVSLGTSALSAVCVAVGLVRLRRRRRVAGYRWMQRAVLIDLLLTRVVVFVENQFAAVPSVVIDLVLLGVFEVAMRDAAEERDARETAPPVEPPAPTPSTVEAVRAAQHTG
jgi:hypothetical protein